MTGDQLGGVVRALLTTGAGILVAKGYIDNSLAQQIVGALVTLIVSAWSWNTNHPDKLK